MIESCRCFLQAQSGTEEPLSEPIKHLLVSSRGDLLRILNVSDLVDYAVESAIVSKGAGISAEEKAAYRQLLLATQQATLTKAVQCDLSFIWSSWVQLWTHEKRSAGAASEAE